jgi:broad specificity phosphatase PhoE
VILLARHGRTADNAEGRILGRRDPPLDRAGRQEAAALAAAVAGAGLAALWTSPLRRARETAAVVGEATGLEPVVLDDLVESRRGAWEGRPFAELLAEEPDAFAAFERGDPDFAFPDGESLCEQAERTRAALDAIARGRRPALAIAHAGTIRAALALTGRPVPPERALAHGEAIPIAYGA